MTTEPTPSQTIGPFFAVMRVFGDSVMIAAGDPDAIRIEGRVLDGAGAPVPDAMLEVWQANRAGKYAHPADTQEKLLEPGFTGFGRCSTNSEGRFSFVTVKPGRVPNEDGGLQAPHLVITIFARGLLKRLVTRMYFQDEAAANAEDTVLGTISDPEARQSLMAEPVRPGVIRFDVRLQGEGETAFFAV